MLELLVLGADPKILGACAFDVVAGVSLGLLTPTLNPLNAPDDAAVELLPGADD